MKPINAESARPVSAIEGWDKADQLVTDFLRQEAEKQGLTYAEYCDKYGIIGPAQERQVKRHEVTEADVSDNTKRDMENRTGWTGDGLVNPNASVITASSPDRGIPHAKRDS